MQDLGSLEASAALGVNSHGDVVGTDLNPPSFDEGFRRHGWLYTDEFGMLRLDSLVVNQPENTIRQDQDLSELASLIRQMASL